MSLGNYDTDEDYVGEIPREPATDALSENRDAGDNDLDREPQWRDLADEKYRKYVVAENSTAATRWHANDGGGSKNWNRLWKRDRGVSDDQGSRTHLMNQEKVDDRRRAEAFLGHLGLAPDVKKAVVEYVAKTDLRCYSSHYSGVDGAIIGELGYQLADTPEEALKDDVIVRDAVQSLANDSISEEEEVESLADGSIKTGVQVIADETDNDDGAKKTVADDNDLDLEALFEYQWRKRTE